MPVKKDLLYVASKGKFYVVSRKKSGRGAIKTKDFTNDTGWIHIHT